MERYRYFKGLTGSDVAGIFDKYRIFDYITRYFESLHTMGDRCIVQDIDDYICGINGEGRLQRGNNEVNISLPQLCNL